MDRIINVKVGGNYLSKDNKNAGVRGEANVTQLRIAFDESWEHYAKKVTFWDARGLNPVERLLTIDYLENIVESTLIYLVPIPAEPLAEAGMLTFVIDGYNEGKVQRSLSDKLSVKDAPIPVNPVEPADPTPSQVEQLQGEIENIKNDIQDVYTASKEITDNKNIVIDAVRMADTYKTDAYHFAYEAKGYANTALEACDHYPRIINDHWYIWNVAEKYYKNTGVRAQAGSIVYMGDNPPADADVWINPEGETANYATVAYVEARLLELANKVAPSPASVTLYKNRWEQVEDKQKWYQEVYVENATITEYSKIDLQLSANQIDEFYGTAFVAENDNKTVTVFCFGSIPDRDVTIHAKVSEVVVNG